MITGFGVYGYVLALEAMLHLLKQRTKWWPVFPSPSCRELSSSGKLGFRYRWCLRNLKIVELACRCYRTGIQAEQVVTVHSAQP